MHSLDELWGRLADIQTLRFTSESRTGIGWQGRGSGIVTVQTASPEVLLFHELGYWRQLGGEELRFTNVYRWTRLEDRVRLEHLRFGARYPIFLFEMAPDAAGIWHALEPHACNLDRYSAVLKPGFDSLDIQWFAYGPTRDETMNYIYV